MLQSNLHKNMGGWKKTNGDQESKEPTSPRPFSPQNKNRGVVANKPPSYLYVGFAIRQSSIPFSSSFTLPSFGQLLNTVGCSFLTWNIKLLLNLIVECTCSQVFEIGLPKFKLPFCCFLAVWLGSSFLTSLEFHFLSHKMGIIHTLLV